MPRSAWTREIPAQQTASRVYVMRHALGLGLLKAHPKNASFRDPTTRTVAPAPRREPAVAASARRRTV